MYLYAPTFLLPPTNRHGRTLGAIIRLRVALCVRKAVEMPCGAQRLHRLQGFMATKTIFWDDESTQKRQFVGALE